MLGRCLYLIMGPTCKSQCNIKTCTRKHISYNIVATLRELLLIHTFFFFKYIKEREENSVLTHIVMVVLVVHSFYFHELFLSMLICTHVKYPSNVHHVYIWGCDFEHLGFVMGAKINPYSYYLNCVKVIIIVIALFCGHEFE